MKEIVFYDMDNTLAEMSEKLQGVKSAELNDYYSGNRAEILRKLESKGFFEDLKLIDNASEVIKQLIDKDYDVRILSQPMNTPHCIDEKNYWLDTFIPYIPRYKRIYTFDKWLLAGYGRILIDDNVSHLDQWGANKGTPVCFFRGYNESYKGIGIHRHDEIFEVLELFERMDRDY